MTAFLLAIMMTAAPDSAWEWKAEAPPGGEHTPRRVMFGRGTGCHFSADAATRVAIGQGPDDQLRLTGPLTLSAMVQPFACDAPKRAIVSKWRLSDTGRSYELGITPERRVFFTISSAGTWDETARELLSDDALRIGEIYLLHAVFEPGREMTLYINGHRSGRITENIPRRIYDSDTPVMIGNRPTQEDSCGFDGIIAGVRIEPQARDALAIVAEARVKKLTHNAEALPFAQVPPLTEPYDLDVLREQFRIWYEMLQATGEPYGAYRLTTAKPPDMYASADIAWIRWIMNDLDLTDRQRAEWIDFLQDQQNEDGTYRHITGHCDTHAFCHVTGALNALGGRHRFHPALLDKYRDPAGIPAWLDNIDWVHQWGASHDIWGAGVPLASTPETPEAWCETLFAWLDAEADPETGLWRKGVKARSDLEYIGGAFHIWPIYAIKNHPIPHPEGIIDHILKLQQENGSFDGVFHYGGMDCVWALEYLGNRTTHRADDVRRALEKNLHGMMRLYNDQPRRFFIDAHGTESRVATLAILQAALPEKLKSRRPWRNPWHHRELFVIRYEGK